MFSLEIYRERSSIPVIEAQRNLMTRTHYVDPDTMRFHKSRIVSTRIVDNGLIFVLVESIPSEYQSVKRVFRFVAFDIAGRVIERAKMESSWSTKKAATAAMWKWLETIDAKQITREALEHAQWWLSRDIAELKDKAGIEPLPQPSEQNEG